jgi:hypothetical protein
MNRFVRKTAPAVRGGKVQYKNRWERSRGWQNHRQDVPAIDRARPGAGCRHLLRKADVERFLALLPDWDELSRGVDVILLAEGGGSMGWYQDGLVAVCAWERELAWESDIKWLEEHRTELERLGVPIERRRKGLRWLGWTERTAKAFQLVHILLHELGHHHDRMTTRSRRECARGESYAERYALEHADRIWDAYVAEFGTP